jgi:hypothetical protein
MIALRRLALIAAGVLAAGCLLAAGTLFYLLREQPLRPAAGISIGILGDSDSHSYHDTISFPAGSPERGGAYRATTFQWPEVLARLRGDQVDLGEWGVWGTNNLVEHVRAWGKRTFRSPRREDYRYNYSVSGARCEDLSQSPQRQAASLLSLMDADPERWRDGVVVIRIGVNSIGQPETLDHLARNPDDATVALEMAWCVGQIAKTVEKIRAHHPQVGIVLVGVFDNSNWSNTFDRWRSAQEIDNIYRGLAHFNSALQALARDNQRVAFFDDQAWFAQLWGSRNADGIPDYHSVRIADVIEVSNSQGDTPDNSVVADGHAGLVWNVLWTKALIDVMNEQLGTGIAPLQDAQIRDFILQQTQRAATSDQRQRCRPQETIIGRC